jgi:nicotinate phosphoribosyltransferase
MIWDEEHPNPSRTMVDPVDPTRRRAVPGDAAGSDLLVPVLRSGQRTSPAETLDAMRARVREQLSLFHGGVKRFLNPHRYPVGFEQGLYERRTALILAARGHP